MTVFDPASLSVTEAHRLLCDGSLQAEALLEAVIARILALDPVIHSYLRHDFAGARAAAVASAARYRAGQPLGPLDGIPFGVKDNIYTRGLATTAGSAVPQRHDPELHAHLVARLQAGGAILLGKLNTWEYGTGDGSADFTLPDPPARNPHNPRHFTGGSSSGAGAAVAAGTAMFAIGTDTGGSVRLPAAGCGVVGLKPTFGRISRHGILPNCWSFDTAGPLALTVADAALIYDALAGGDPQDPSCLQRLDPAISPTICAPLAGLKIGRIRNLEGPSGLPGPAILDALDRAAAVLQAAGAELVEMDLPVAPGDYRAVSLPINRAESYSSHELDHLEHRDLMGRSLRDKLDIGMHLRAADYLAALRARRDLVARTDALFADVQVILLPMTWLTAPEIRDDAAVRSFTHSSAGSPFSLSGHPAVAIPAGFDAAGLPVSVQLAAAFCREDRLMQVALHLERGFGPARRICPQTLLAQGETCHD